MQYWGSIILKLGCENLMPANTYSFFGHHHSMQAHNLHYTTWTYGTQSSHDIKVHTHAQHRNWLNRLRETHMVLYMLHADPAHHVLSRTDGSVACILVAVLGSPKSVVFCCESAYLPLFFCPLSEGQLSPRTRCPSRHVVLGPHVPPDV